MSKKVMTIDGDTVDRILYSHLGDYSANTEAVFFKLNPHVIGHVVLPRGISIAIPAPRNETSQKRKTVWD